MADKIENLKQLAEQCNIRSPAKLVKMAMLEGVDATIPEAQEALKTDLAR